MSEHSRPAYCCLRCSFCILVLAGGRLSILAAGTAEDDFTRRVSVNSSGVESNGRSDYSSVSGDGRFVVFDSTATNLVLGDGNSSRDVFLHDRMTGQTTRVSVGPGGVEANGDSLHPSISADGNVISYYSTATNLVPSDTNGYLDVFVYDRPLGQTTRVSVASGGTEADDDSFDSALSADGRFVAFKSDADNLVPGDTGFGDIFVHDRSTATTVRVSVGSGGLQANSSSFDPCISGDGQLVAFRSCANNLVPNDANGNCDIFVHDLGTMQTSRVSVDSAGNESNNESRHPFLAFEGRYVAFASRATNLVAGDTNRQEDVFVHDRVGGQTVRASLTWDGKQVFQGSYYPVLAGDGRRVVFFCGGALTADPLESDLLFSRDLIAGTVSVACRAADGSTPNADCIRPAISADGRFVAFTSSADNLDPSDTNGESDVFVNGPELTLDADPDVVSAGQTLTLTTYEGVPGNLAGLWVVGIDGIPWVLKLSFGSFGAGGLFTVSGVVPGGLGMVDVTFRTYAIGRTTALVATNDVSVAFR